MKKDWRQTRWKDFSSSQKTWFSILCITLVVILVLAGLSSSEVATIPDWITVCVVAFGFYALCRFAKLTPWALMGFDPEDAEDEEE